MHFRASRSPKNAESGEGLRPFEPRVKVAVQGLNIQIIHSYMVTLLWLNDYL